MFAQSLLEQARQQYNPKLPSILNEIDDTTVLFSPKTTSLSDQIAKNFPHIKNKPLLAVVKGKAKQTDPLRVGVVFSGGQASGGHNVISGLFDALKKMNSKSILYGFLNGPSGIVENSYIEITEDLLLSYRNQGGFDLIGSGRTKIETTSQLEAAVNTVRILNLDGLVIIGGDDSNTNAAILAEYFIAHDTKTSVIGVPKTIDGDLKNDDIEISFGFDTATKTYSEIIGNLTRDALSAKKYYYFVKLMGRSASHIALECALQTHPNLTLIGEEVAANKSTLKEVVQLIVELVKKRAADGKNYGVILIPEGLIEFIPEVKVLITELNALLANNTIVSQEEKIAFILKNLSTDSTECFQILPKNIQAQLLIGRDAHGNVQVSKIETERLLIEMVKSALKEQSKMGNYKGKFDPQPLFCGYEGRSCLPSNFDCNYCYSLGHLAALLINNHATGYICSIKNTSKPTENWELKAVPLVSIMTMEERHGMAKPVIKKALVDLKGAPYKAFVNSRDGWAVNDDYIYPGPIQFFGPEAITDSITKTLALEGSQESSFTHDVNG